MKSDYTHLFTDPELKKSIEAKGINFYEFVVETLGIIVEQFKFGLELINTTKKIEDKELYLAVLAPEAKKLLEEELKYTKKLDEKISRVLGIKDGIENGLITSIPSKVDTSIYQGLDAIMKINISCFAEGNGSLNETALYELCKMCPNATFADGNTSFLGTEILDAKDELEKIKAEIMHNSRDDEEFRENVLKYLRANFSLLSSKERGQGFYFFSLLKNRKGTIEAIVKMEEKLLGKVINIPKKDLKQNGFRFSDILALRRWQMAKDKIDFDKVNQQIALLDADDSLTEEKRIKLKLAVLYESLNDRTKQLGTNVEKYPVEIIELIQKMIFCQHLDQDLIMSQQIQYLEENGFSYKEVGIVETKRKNRRPYIYIFNKNREGTVYVIGNDKIEPYYSDIKEFDSRYKIIETSRNLYDRDKSETDNSLQTLGEYHEKVFDEILYNTSENELNRIENMFDSDEFEIT